MLFRDGYCTEIDPTAEATATFLTFSSQIIWKVLKIAPYKGSCIATALQLQEMERP